MKQISLLPFYLTLSVMVHAEQKPQVPQCFKVNSLIRMDEDHYWANWTNACAYTVDSVYINVEFVDGDRRTLGGGLWSMHFVTPGAHQVTRLSTPPGVSDFRFIRVRKVTTTLDEALQDRQHQTQPEHAQ